MFFAILICKQYFSYFKGLRRYVPGKHSNFSHLMNST